MERQSRDRSSIGEAVKIMGRACFSVSRKLGHLFQDTVIVERDAYWQIDAD